VIDVKGAFLKGNFVDGGNLYLHIPQGFETFYKKDEVLNKNLTIYSLKHAALAFWKKLFTVFQKHGSQEKSSISVSLTSRTIQIAL
jgi:hypothetical protein